MKRFFSTVQDDRGAFVSPAKRFQTHHRKEEGGRGRTGGPTEEAYTLAPSERPQTPPYAESKKFCPKRRVSSCKGVNVGISGKRVVARVDKQNLETLKFSTHERKSLP